MDWWEERLDDDSAPVYPIGVVAAVLEVSVQVIRRYDEEGVVEPDRSAGGQRRYSRRDVARLARTLKLADEGISTPGIKRILDLEDQLADTESQLDSGDDTGGEESE